MSLLLLLKFTSKVIWAIVLQVYDLVKFQANFRKGSPACFDTLRPGGDVWFVVPEWQKFAEGIGPEIFQTKL